MITNSLTELEALINQYRYCIDIRTPLVPGYDYIQTVNKASILEKVEDLGYCWYFNYNGSSLKSFKYKNRIGFIVPSSITSNLLGINQVRVSFYIASRKVTEYIIPVLENG
jgi:hypothetical protein